MRTLSAAMSAQLALPGETLFPVSILTIPLASGTVTVRLCREAEITTFGGQMFLPLLLAFGMMDEAIGLDALALNEGAAQIVFNNQPIQRTLTITDSFDRPNQGLNGNLCDGNQSYSWTTGGGMVVRSNGASVQGGAIPAVSPDYGLLTPGVNVADATVSGYVTLGGFGSGDVRLFVRHDGTSDGYGMVIDTQFGGRGTARVRVYRNDTTTILGTYSTGFPYADSHKYTLAVAGGHMRVHIDDGMTPVIDVSDGTVTAPGNAGFRVHNITGYSNALDNFAFVGVQGVI